MCKKIIRSIGSFLFFCQSKIANYFYSKINDSSRVKTTGFSSSRSRVRVWVSVLPNIFMISLTFIRNSSGSLGTVGGTRGFWSGSYGFKSQPLPPFLPWMVQQKIVIPPPPPSYAWKVLIIEIFWNQEGFLYEILKFFGTVNQKNSVGKSWYPAPLLSLTFFDTRN